MGPKLELFPYTVLGSSMESGKYLWNEKNDIYEFLQISKELVVLTIRLIMVKFSFILEKYVKYLKTHYSSTTVDEFDGYSDKSKNIKATETKKSCYKFVSTKERLYQIAKKNSNHLEVIKKSSWMN